MRLFVAIDCPEIEDYFFSLQELLPKAELTLAKSFHLTLKFLGNVDDSSSIINSLKEIKFHKFEFHLDNLGYFIDSKINVLWIGIQPKNDVIKLAESVDKTLKEFGNSEKEFIPHITLARVKNIDDKKSFLESYNKIIVDKKKIKIDNFLLMESVLTPSGPIYREIKRFILA